MGAKALQSKFDITERPFLGAGDEHVMYLQNYYANNLNGTEEQKFEMLIQLIENNDQLQELLDQNSI